MPRDASGNYTLAAGNPVVSGTVITPTWANPTMDDLALAMTDSLSRTGDGGMLVPFQNVDGDVGNPGMTFGLEPTTGFSRTAVNTMTVSIGGVQSSRWIFGDFGFEIWSGTAWVKPLINGAQTISGVQTFSAQARFELAWIVPNNVAFQAEKADTTAVGIGRMSNADVWVFGNSTVDSAWRSLAVGDIQVNAISVAQFQATGLVLPNTIELRGETTVAVQKNLINLTNVNEVAVGDATVDQVHRALAQLRTAIGGSIVSEWVSGGLEFALDGRIFFNDSLGDPRTAMFLQADNEIRIGGTGMPFVSLRCEPLGLIKFNVGTTVSQEMSEDSIICKSKGVTTANSSHLQFQDFNSLNTGRIGNLAGFDDLFIQGQGGQNVRFECLSVSYDALSGTTASAANARLDGVTKNLLVVTSARKYKKDIAPIARTALNRVLDMTPIRYRSRSKADDPNVEHYGLIAEDVHAVDPRLVSLINGKPESVQYERLSVLLLGVVKDMAKRLEVLEHA